MTTENVSEPLPNLADPEAAALEPIVRLPADLLGGNWPTRETSQELAATTVPGSCACGQVEHPPALTAWHGMTPPPRPESVRSGRLRR
jgi:hypothetical protein